jgi:hypothetical protein
VIRCNNNPLHLQSVDGRGQTKKERKKERKKESKKERKKERKQGRKEERKKERNKQTNKQRSPLGSFFSNLAIAPAISNIFHHDQ